MLLGFFLLLGIFTIVVEATLFPVFPAWLGRPDFLYILVVFAAYRFSWLHGLFLVFMLGWMMDVISGIHLGIYPLQNIIVFSLLKLLTENSPLKESAYQVPLVGVSYFLVQMFFYFLYSLVAPGTLPVWSWNIMIQESFILLLATIPSFIIFNFFYEYFCSRKAIHRVISKKSGNQFR